ncbi:MAG: stalk domain-containing protein [Clostridia bacterium]|nr:stalk domain-containing protein [Clostridia bacterium]
MKKVLAFAMALVILACCSLAVAEGRAKTPAGQIEGGPKVYFVIESAFFKADSDIIIIGQKGNEYYKRYDQPVATTKVDDDLLVPVDAMSKIFQFTYEYDAATGAIHLEDEFVKADLAIGSKDVTINGAADTLGAAPAEVDGVLCVPAVSVGTKVFELVTGESLGYTYLSYVETELPAGSTGNSGKITQLTMPGKIYGIIEPVYWFEEAQMLMPYRATIPTSYDPEVPNGLVVFLHGGSGNDNRDVERATVYGGESGYLWDFVMDKYGFIGLSVNAYCQGDYGSKANNSNPATARASVLCEHEVLAAIEQIKQKYNIDESRIFLMGNSMGGLGTLWMACDYPELFAGISPSPGFNPTRDLSVLGDTPIRVVPSTEDKGYNTALANYKLWKEKGLNITFRGVCGGAHSIGWSEVLDETIAFFASVK